MASRATAGACHRDGSVTNASRTAWLRGDIRDIDVTVPGTGHVRLSGGKLAAQGSSGGSLDHELSAAEDMSGARHRDVNVTDIAA